MAQQRGGSKQCPAEIVADFPETQSALLAEAAAGSWDRFLEAYLAPCWREILIACRGRGIPLDEAADLYQELSVRLLRQGRSRFSGGHRHGNLPDRYLQHRAAGLASARFRTFLKQVIHNLILEQLRRQRRRPRPLEDDSALEPWIVDSVSGVLDRHWVADCLVEAARRLEQESRAARTRGQRRLFLVLYLASAQGLPAEKIAAQLGLDRTTVVQLLSRSRQRFVAILAEVTGIADRDELKRHVAADPEQLLRALSAVQTESRGAAERQT